MRTFLILSMVLALACSSAYACGMGGEGKDGVETMGSGEMSPTS